MATYNARKLTIQNGGDTYIIDPLQGNESVYIDLTANITTSDWTASSGVYTYVYTNSHITANSVVVVYFKDGIRNGLVGDLKFTKSTGYITFVTDEAPIGTIPLLIRVIDGTVNGVYPVDADMVETDAIVGETTVQGCLEDLDTRVTDNEEALGIIDSHFTETEEAIAKCATSVNNVKPDPDTGDVPIHEVEFARQIVTDDAQESTGEFLFRTTGGDASLSDGDAKLVSIKGRSIHTGIVEEQIDLSVNMAERGDDDPIIEATLNRAIFVEAMTESGTLTLTYTSNWSEDPANYGITVTGTPLSGDEIVVVYVKEDRGLITSSNPSSFVSTGWNLYNHTNGYARVKKYSNTYGFLIGGAYSAIQFSATLDGEKETITPASGYFAIPSDGYIWVTGGNSTTTYILMTWSDWGEGYEGDWEAYSETTVSLSAIMANFPNGLMQVGSAADEINFSMKRAISRIEKMEYTAQNLADVISSGRDYDADEDYIYAVRESEIIYVISATGDYTASDHGQEIIIGGTVLVLVQTLYGRNLVDYLRHDIPEQIATLNSNIGNVPSGKTVQGQIDTLNSNIDALFIKETKIISYGSTGYGTVGFKTGYTLLTAWCDGSGGPCMVYYTNDNGYALWSQLQKSAWGTTLVWAKLV